MFAARSPKRAHHNPVASNKAACRRAYEAARGAGGLVAMTAERFWSETLLAVEHRASARRAEMFERTRMLLELIRDRASWPR